MGVNGFYVTGSTGEAFLLSTEERKEVMDIVKATAPDKVLIAHVGSVSEATAIELGEYAKKLNYDMVSSVSPFYYKFSFKEIKDYYCNIADASGLPMLVYHIPAFSGVNMGINEMSQFLLDDRFIGIKFTSNDFFTLEQAKAAFPDKLVYNGYDEMIMSGLAMGADGAIGSTYNFMADKFVKIYNLMKENKIEEAREIQNSANKIITVKIDNNGSSAYTQVRVEGKNGIKLTDASIGDGINENATVTLSSNGSYVTFKKSNLLPAGKEGYLYLKYDGEVDPTKLPVLVRMYTSSGESRVYTVFCDTNAKNADIGSPIFAKHEESTAESTEIEPAEAESTKELIPDSEATQTMPTDNADENNSSLILPIALGAAAAAAICAVAFIISKKKRK
jgi:N-acetylneuraminate lyase